MSGFHPGQLSFVLRAASDTLPTPVNLGRWHVQSDVKCILCDSARPTTAHILGGCPVALSQQRYTYRHDRPGSSFNSLQVEGIVQICVYADFQGWRSSESPQATTPSALVPTPFSPDIVVYNSAISSVVILELTCPLDSEHHILSTRSRKQSKPDYLQSLSEFDRLQISTVITMKQWKLVYLDITNRPLFKVSKNLLNSYSLLLQQNQSSLIVQLQLV